MEISLSQGKSFCAGKMAENYRSVSCNMYFKAFLFRGAKYDGREFIEISAAPDLSQLTHHCDRGNCLKCKVGGKQVLKLQHSFISLTQREGDGSQVQTEEGGRNKSKEALYSYLPRTFHSAPQHTREQQQPVVVPSKKYTLKIIPSTIGGEPNVSVTFYITVWLFTKLKCCMAALGFNSVIQSINLSVR